MRPDLLRRLREISKSHSSPEKRVTRVTRVTDAASHTLSHVGVTRSAPEKDQRNQSVTRVTRVTPSKTEIGVSCHTSQGVTPCVTERVTVRGIDPDDWFTHFEERAAIREYEGGFDRPEAEQLAMDDTVAALGPRPGIVH